MIHLFEALGKRMALDVGSGAVLSLDPVAYDALSVLVENPEADVAAALEGRHDKAETRLAPHFLQLACT